MVTVSVAVSASGPLQWRSSSSRWLSPSEIAALGRFRCDLSEVCILSAEAGLRTLARLVEALEAEQVGVEALAGTIETPGICPYVRTGEVVGVVRVSR